MAETHSAGAAGAGARDRIARVEVRMVHSHLRSKRAQGVGSVESLVKRVLLRLTTEDGIEGWGEAAPWEVFSGTAEGVAAALDVHLRPLVLGAPAGRIDALMARCERALFAHPEAKAALEMALYDILGKRLGAPVHALLGGAVRMAIPMSFSLANPDTEADVAAAQALIASNGIRIFKVKTGFSTHAEDVRRLTRFRATLPEDIDLRVDYNQGLDPWDAIRTLRDIEAFRPTFIEQPVPRDQRAAMAAITSALDTPVMADESVFSPTEMLEAARLRIADIVSIKLMKSGGIGPARKISAIAEAAGMPCYGGTLFEGGIALTAATHFIASTANVSLGCEFYTPRFAFIEDIAVPKLPVEQGAVMVPEGPGLGIGIDEAALARQTVEVRG